MSRTHLAQAWSQPDASQERMNGENFLPVTDDLLAEVTRRIVETVQPEQIILFGSHADGAPQRDSDVDLLVIMESALPPAQRALAICRLLRPRPFPVDIVVKTPAEVAAALEKHDDFLSAILRSGRVLYAR